MAKTVSNEKASLNHTKYLEINLSLQQDYWLFFIDLFSDLSLQKDYWLFFIDLFSDLSLQQDYYLFFQMYFGPFKYLTIIWSSPIVDFRVRE